MIFHDASMIFLVIINITYHSVFHILQWFIILCVLPLIILALVVGSVAAGMSGSVSIT